MLRRSLLAAIAFVSACSPLSETADVSRLDEGKTFVVPAGERWGVETIGLESDAVAAVLLKVDGATRVTLWPARDGRRIEFAKRIALGSGQRVEVCGAASDEPDSFCVLRRDELPPPASNDWTRATASGDPRVNAKSTHVYRRDIDEFARASAWTITGETYYDDRPVRDVVLWAFWDDGLVLFRIDPNLDRGEYEVGRVPRERIDALARSWEAFLAAPPVDALYSCGIHTRFHQVCVRMGAGDTNRALSDQHWQDWIASDRRPDELGRTPHDAVALLHAAVYDAAREGAACELPTLTLDGLDRWAFDDDEPVIRAKR
ncbi:MAG: hypothetical protein K8S98_08910 [Planctomycetes bacterium]|nr:hypothetical protein [Planctomycetota bacterium]